MKHKLWMQMVCVGCLAVASIGAEEKEAATGAEDKEADWVSLFDGKTLEGWIQKNGTAEYRVEDGAIIGKTAEGSPNSFLCSEKEYGDFEIEFEVKVFDNALNSGMQVRSQTAPATGDAKFGRVNGPQVEIEASGGGGAESGYIFGEGMSGGWRTPRNQLRRHKVFKDQAWNQYRVVAKGPVIQTWINGTAITTLTDAAIFKSHPKGFFGLQVHGIPRGKGPYQVGWRNIRIKSMDEK